MSMSPSLAEALRFSDADLTTNQAGELSISQRAMLQKRQTRTMLIGMSLFFVLAFIATFFIFIAGKSDNAGILLVIGIGLTLCNAVMSGIFFRYWLKLNADLRANRVHRLSGELHRVLKPLNRRVIYYLIRIDTVETVVSKEIFTAFTHEATYTLYRTPYTGILLSAEQGVI